MKEILELLAEKEKEMGTGEYLHLSIYSDKSGYVMEYDNIVISFGDLKELNDWLKK